MFDSAHALTGAIQEIETALPPPISPLIFKQPLDMAGGLLTLYDQYAFERYKRYGSEMILSASAISLPFHWIVSGSGALKPLNGYARYTWEVAVVNPDGSFGPYVERARCDAPKAAPLDGQLLVGAFGNEADGLLATRVVGYDASGARSPDSRSPVYLIYLDRSGKAKDHPCYPRQWASFEWSRTGIGGQHCYAICFHASARDEARPLVERAGAPFSDQKLSTEMAIVLVAPRQDPRTTPRQRFEYASGVIGTAGLQGYEWQEVVRPVWTHYPRFGGPRGIRTSGFTLALYVGRRFKRYETSPRALWNTDSRGYARNLFGEDWPQDYAPSFQELLGPKPDPRVRYQGQPRPGGLVSARGVNLAAFTLPAGLEPCPQECWSISIDGPSTVTDPTLPPIGGENPHPGYVAMALPDSRGLVWRLDFNGRDRSKPGLYSIPFYAKDPWTVRLRNGIAFVTERTNPSVDVTMYDFDTGDFIGTLIAADAQKMALGAINDARYFSFNAGKTRAIARTLSGCPWPEGMWLEDNGDGTGSVYVGAFALGEVRRWRVNWNDATRHPSLISAQHDVAFRPVIDPNKSHYVLLEGNRTPAEAFGPPGWVSCVTWSNVSPPGAFPAIYVPSPGNDTDGTPILMTKRWNPWGPAQNFLARGRNGVEVPTYAQAMSCAHARFECTSAEDGILALMLADPALDGPVLTAAQVATIQAQGQLYDKSFEVACGNYGFGEQPLPWGQGCDDFLQFHGHVKP